MAGCLVAGITFSRWIRDWHKRAYLASLEAVGFSCLELYPARGNPVSGRHSLDALVLAGGGDVHPSFYGDTNRHCQLVDQARDRFELEIFQRALDKNTPVLGICRGIQAINVFMGGSLYQDIEAEKPAPQLPHHVPLADAGYRHEVEAHTDSFLAAPMPSGNAWVNSHHHQAVKDLGNGLRAVAWARDGIVEAVEAVGAPVYGIQWHPELLGEEARPLLRWFYTVCLSR